MRAISPITFVCLLLAGAVLTACERRILGDCPDDAASARLPVVVDWSESGITPTSRADADYVHRVSLRFFPKDGSAVFDRYLEGDVFAGDVDVPVGNYSVVAFNESIYDTYWNDALYFTGVDNYNSFAANLVDDNPDNYDFYATESGAKLSQTPLKLASWSLDNFEVKPSMTGDPMYYALTKIKLRQLTFEARIAVEATRLNSSMTMHGIFKGIVHKVMMASAEPVHSPTTHIFVFNAITWNDPAQTDGVIRAHVLTFGKQPVESSAYWLALDVILKSGTRYTPATPLLFEVSDQVHATSDKNIEIGVKIALPELDSGVDVGDWEDQEVPIL